ncbi:MAG: hypothetical protein ACI8VE_001652 [Natrialbaceae archaeon]
MLKPFPAPMADRIPVGPEMVPTTHILKPEAREQTDT